MRAFRLLSKANSIHIRSDRMKRPTFHAMILYSKEVVIAAIALIAIAVHPMMRFGFETSGAVYGISWPVIPLLAALVLGGIPLIAGHAIRLARFDFSSDLLASISIVTAVVLGKYLAGTLVVLVLSGGQALEAYAVRRASSAWQALAIRMPSQAHRQENGAVIDLPLAAVAVGDLLVVFPHETCPVDGVVNPPVSGFWKYGKSTCQLTALATFLLTH